MCSLLCIPRLRQRISKERCFKIKGSVARIFVRGILFAFALPVVTCALGQSNPRAASQGLTVIAPSDPNFDGLLGSYFGAISTAPLYPQMRPYFLLLRNDTGSTAEGYSVGWETRTAGGAVYHTEQTFVARHRQTEENAVKLAPGDIRLVTPFINVTPAQYRSRRDEVNSLPLAIVCPHEIAAGDTVTPMLEAAIFDDRTVFGDANSSVMKQFSPVRNAERDTAIAFLKLVRQQANVQTIAGSLQKDIETGLSVFGNSAHDVYLRKRGAESSTLLNSLKTQGLDATVSLASTAANAKRETIGFDN